MLGYVFLCIVGAVIVILLGLLALGLCYAAAKGNFIEYE